MAGPGGWDVTPPGHTHFYHSNSGEGELPSRCPPMVPHVTDFGRHGGGPRGYGLGPAREVERSHLGGGPRIASSWSEGSPTVPHVTDSGRHGGEPRGYGLWPARAVGKSHSPGPYDYFMTTLQMIILLRCWHW